MSRWVTVLVAIGLAATVSACSASKEEPAEVGPSVPAQATVEPEPPAMPVTGEKEDAVQKPESTNSLVGTIWKVGDFVATFYEPPDVLIKGGRLDETHPDGVMGSYKLENGIIEVSVLDQSRAGVYDGTRMVVDGVAGVQLQ